MQLRQDTRPEGSQSTALTHRQLQARAEKKGQHLNPLGCHCGDLAINIETVSPSELDGKTNNCMENVSVKDVRVSGYSFGIFELKI